MRVFFFFFEHKLLWTLSPVCSKKITGKKSPKKIVPVFYYNTIESIMTSSQMITFLLGLFYRIIAIFFPPDYDRAPNRADGPRNPKSNFQIFIFSIITRCFIALACVDTIDIYSRVSAHRLSLITTNCILHVTIYLSRFRYKSKTASKSNRCLRFY